MHFHLVIKLKKAIIVLYLFSVAALWLLTRQSLSPTHLDGIIQHRILYLPPTTTTHVTSTVIIHGPVNIMHPITVSIMEVDITLITIIRSRFTPTTLTLENIVHHLGLVPAIH